MRDFKTLFFVLLVLSFAAVGFAQPGQLAMYYFNDPPGSAAPLGWPCASPTDHPFPDGVSVCVFWDRNNNGPDDADVQPDTGQGYGQVNRNCFSLNGGSGGMGDGYFYFDDPAFEVRDVPSGADSPTYWLQVNSNGICWRTTSFTVTTGFNAIQFPQSAWNCSSLPCPVTGPVPDAPTAVTATHDSCLQVTMTWEHDGLNHTAGFIVIDPNGLTMGPALDAATRTTRFDVLTDRAQNYCVKAFNASGNSLPSDSASGSAYLLKFADAGPTGNNLRNTAFTAHLRWPDEGCHSGAKLYLLYWSATHVPAGIVRGPLLASDSLTNILTGHFPNDSTLNCCRLLLLDSSFANTRVYSDTTPEASSFNLGSHCDEAAGEFGGLVPDQFELAQNFPNPFNPSTEIRFNVPVQASIRIRVYNIMGQEVRTLTEGVFTPGIHMLTWDGTTNNGISVGAGIYLCRMEAPGYMMTKKMLLLK